MTETTTPAPGGDPETNGHTPPTATAGQQIPVPAAELGELMDAAIRKAVAAEFDAAARDIAAEVVDAFLTDEMREQMAETAAHEVELAFNPPATAEPEPESAPAPAPTPEEEPQRLYANVYEFVEEYVAQVYRREVCERGVDAHRRWCPQWWRHGEARGRLKALWMAFEALRQGETVEQSIFWINHFAPHMNALFDPEGPFKYCSALDGHQSQDALVALPVVPWPGGDEDAVLAEPVHSSGLLLPTGATVHHRRVIRTEFP